MDSPSTNLAAAIDAMRDACSLATAAAVRSRLFGQADLDNVIARVVAVKSAAAELVRQLSIPAPVAVLHGVPLPAAA